jgi:hypothetical protein
LTTNKELSKDKISLYLEAFKFNWDKAKHVDNQRLQVFYFNIAILIASFSIIAYVGFPYFMVLFYIISFLSFLLFLIIVKFNVEISACMATLQWISEKLELIREMEDKEKENLKTELKKIGIKKISKYAFYKEAYISLSIPLPQRVHDVMTYFSEFQTTSFASIALYFTMHYFLPASLSSISLIIEVTCSLCSFILIFCFLHWFILEKVKKEAVVIKKARMPPEITVWKEGKEIT